MKDSQLFDESSCGQITSQAPEILGAPDETESARETTSQAEKGHLENLDCQAQPSSSSNALQLVRTFAPDEARQLCALRLLFDAPSTEDRNGEPSPY